MGSRNAAALGTVPFHDANPSSFVKEQSDNQAYRSFFIADGRDFEATH
jgi:hypothetical protein